MNVKFGPHLLISFRKCIQRFLRLPPRGSNDFLNFNLDAQESLRHANLTQPLPSVYAATKLVGQTFREYQECLLMLHFKNDDVSLLSVH